MESVGEETRIRTLYSELRLADAQAAPSFAATWNRAQIKSVKRRGFNLAFAAATALLVCAVASLAWWSSHSQPQPANAVAVTDPTVGVTPVTTPSVKESTPSEPALPAHQLVSSHRRRAPQVTDRRQSIARAADKKVLLDAAAISNWQSPTATLLTTSNDELFKSLPTLDENSKEMKTFLPNK